MARGRPTEWTVNTAGMRNLSRALRTVGPTMPLRLSKALKVGAEFIAVDARARAGWSTRIPGTIRVGGGVAKVTISAGGSGAPHAAAFENRGKEGEFRHPVHGHTDRWVGQEARPYLVPALEAGAPQLELVIDAVIDETIRTI
jgi:hypothetical protein